MALTSAAGRGGSVGAAAWTEAASGHLAELMNARTLLTVLPTPLHPLHHLSRLLDREIWMKRDDLTGLAVGGNKARKMELLAADAVRKGADTLLTVGAAQSNHARTVAAVASTLGLRCELVLAGPPPAAATGNLALDVLFGARLRFAGTSDWTELQLALDEAAAALRSAGRHPYPIPAGGSVALGAAAFAAAYLELRAQCAALGLAPATILLASSTGGTQAGLELGRSLARDRDVRVVGVDVAGMAPALVTRVAALWSSTADLLGVGAPDRAPTVLTNHLGPGYAVPTAESAAALVQLARAEGIVADPVYTAKALAALADVTDGGPIVFWHTGGVPALFARQVELPTQSKETACAGPES